MSTSAYASYPYFVTPLALGEKPVLLGERDGRPKAAPGGLCLTLEDVGAIAQLFAKAFQNETELCISPERIIYLMRAFIAMYGAALPGMEEVPRPLEI